MPDSLALPQSAVSTKQKTSSFVWCAAGGIGCLGATKVLHELWGTYVLGLARPASIPDAWWLIDLRATGFAIRELILLALFALFVRLRGLRLVDLGFRTAGTKTAWALALLVLAFGLASHPFVRSGPYELTGYTLYAAIMIGVPVALLEETVYRGFAITTLRTGGVSVPMQILFTGFIFGLSHVSYIRTDWTVPVFTGVLGCIWSWIYIKGRGSLWPTLVAHALNDAVIMPYFYLHNVY